MPQPKSKLKRIAEKNYNEMLNLIEKTMGNQITFTNDLEKFGKYVLGNKFQGVFPSDQTKKLTILKPYSIINLDKSTQPGSHWIALAYDPTEDSVTVYDSFGRKSKKIIPNIYSLYSGVIDTEYDAEQRIREDNCGQRCLAWLMVYEGLGKEAAKLI